MVSLSIRRINRDPVHAAASRTSTPPVTAALTAIRMADGWGARRYLLRGASGRSGVRERVNRPVGLPRGALAAGHIHARQERHPDDEEADHGEDAEAAGAGPQPLVIHFANDD